MRTERSDSSLSTRRACLLPICGSHRVRVNILGSRHFRGQYAHCFAVDVVVHRGFRHHRVPHATESDAVCLHQRCERHAIPGALNSQLRRGGWIERRIVGNRAEDRPHVPGAPTDDHLEGHRCRRLVQPHFPGDCTGKHRRKLIGSPVERFRDLRDLLVHHVAMHARNVKHNRHLGIVLGGRSIAIVVVS